MDQPAILTPSQAREVFRTGETPVTTSGWCRGYVQANLLAVPRDLAFEALLFAVRNPAACPLLEITDPGDPYAREVAAADLRTDLPAYRIYQDGVLVAETPDVTEYWRDDLVAFLIGCSFTFETALATAGVPLRHVEQGRNVPMYVTSRECRPAGRLAGPLVVSMRPVPAQLVDVAVEVTARYPAMHGAPVHIGDPAELGITDLARPQFGDSVEFEIGDVPVFWACGVTPQAAVMASAPPFAITHAPGRMLITDRTEETLVT
ncbi:putative hydro-lyase [Actinoallomurus rhizosphaericola]|uniref:putative hydro-lyase n=1 Tax=Actinoallomurus rhizosphaericola TaxID=2952536 RepID=UPI0020909198|nr:putative hydro-lyase [Actinoallomurus rhizosphaericola]MCO5993688.1 putative hydro-lyase [Actinoallomurus rhizosphaericola]